MSPLRTYAQLCRLPALFTALPDILLGYALVHARLAPSIQLAALLAASGGLYLAGMVFNDLFDRRIDAVERPQRPLPSGRVSARCAAILGAGLLAVGLAAAAAASWNSLLIALLLTANILAYDGWLKRTPLGPFAMGGCRFWNVLLGASSTGGRFVEVFLTPQIVVALGQGVYVAGVTWFARREAENSPRRGLLAGAAVLNLGLLIFASWIAPAGQRLAELAGWRLYPGAAEPWRVLLALGMIALVINRRALAAIVQPSPQQVQAAVRVMLLSIITLDAVLIYNKYGDAGTPAALLTALLIIPSLLLGRWMSMT